MDLKNHDEASKFLQLLDFKSKYLLKISLPTHLIILLVTKKSILFRFLSYLSKL